MSGVGEIVAQQVPFMRRYARAIVGDQAAGDSCVKQCLEALLGRSSGLEVENARLTLFRALDQVLAGRSSPDSVPSNLESSSAPIEGSSILVRRIHGLDYVARRLLILTALERFTLGQAAFILGLEPGEAVGLLDSAKAALREQRSTRILIIEDEPVIALDIARTVEGHGHTVVGMASTHAEAVELARRGQPGLVLADIQLAEDSSGLEAVQEILREIDIPVIFITAYPERLLTGQRPEPTFLITKPFDPDTLAVSIAQALVTAGSRGS
jgi:CheY-like chemotaxis protein/DNA-directed RNA polymerase specialized sigma24 family protein